MYQAPLAILNNTNTTSEDQITETEQPNNITNTNISTGTALCTPGSCNTPIDDPEARKLSSDILNYYNTKSTKSKDIVTEEHTPISDNEKCELVCRKLYQTP